MVVIVGSFSSNISSGSGSSSSSKESNTLFHYTTEAGVFDSAPGRLDVAFSHLQFEHTVSMTGNQLPKYPWRPFMAS